MVRFFFHTKEGMITCTWCNNTATCYYMTCTSSETILRHVASLNCNTGTKFTNQFFNREQRMVTFEEIMYSVLVYTHFLQNRPLLFSINILTGQFSPKWPGSSGCTVNSSLLLFLIYSFLGRNTLEMVLRYIYKYFTSFCV